MQERTRRAFVGTPVKLIAVVLLAVLVPSVLFTGLGLVEVFQADDYVRQEFRRPFDERLSRLCEDIEKAWQRRLDTYATFLKGAGGSVEDRKPYLAQLCERDPAVLDVILAGPERLELVDPDQPRPLDAHGMLPELERLVELEQVDRDPRAALQEAQKLLATNLRDEVRVELLLAAARLSDQRGARRDALDYLDWAFERYGRTINDVGIVRAVPILLRMAEIESQMSSRQTLLVRLPQVDKALRQYARFMPRGAVELFESRLATLRSDDSPPGVYGRVRNAPEPEPGMTAADLDELKDDLMPSDHRRRPSGRRYVTVSHSRLGLLDFVGFTDEEAATTTYLRVDRADFMREASVLCETVGLPVDRVHLVTEFPASDDAISKAAPAPFGGSAIHYDPPDGSLPDRFRAYGVIPVATLTWAVIVCALTLFVGVAFTLRSVMRELQTARLKTDFVSFVTHELKTPLTAIRMYAETMLEGRVSGESDQRMCVQIIDQESQRLMHLIDQILEYSKLERRQKEFQFVSCDMLEVVGEAARIFHDHNQDQPRSVEINSAQHISKIRMDRAAMIELFLNLLSNAAKYSSPDKIIVVNLRESITEISVEVVDQGVGIRKRDQKKIFERFYRADDYLTRDVDGTGLGLAFARFIAKVHNGDIKVTSQFGGGSSFTLCLRKTHVLAE